MILYRGSNKDNTIIQYDIYINRVTTNKYLLGKIVEGHLKQQIILLQ